MKSVKTRALPLPLQEDEHGVLRVAGSRVPINLLVYAYRNGATAEEIALDYPTLKLADIYAVLSLYLLHRDDVDAYLGIQETSSEQNNVFLSRPLLFITK